MHMLLYDTVMMHWSVGWSVFLQVCEWRGVCVGGGGLCVWVIWLSGCVYVGVESVCVSRLVGSLCVCGGEGGAVGVDLCVGLRVGVIVCA